jgi:hypothetical protein
VTKRSIARLLGIARVELEGLAADEDGEGQAFDPDAKPRMLARRSIGTALSMTTSAPKAFYVTAAVSASLRRPTSFAPPTRHAVDHVPAVLSQILRDARLPQRFLPILLSAYGREPHASAFGVTQAITLAAQDASVSAEDRVVLERAAGAYMDRYAIR